MLLTRVLDDVDGALVSAINPHCADQTVRSGVARARKKSDLASKICAHCGLSFSWRKKWERDWEGVRYCSERCRREAKRS